MDAALEAAKIRLRPIIMTSLAFTLGTHSIGCAVELELQVDTLLVQGVVGGMLSATFIAIIFIPLFYIIVTK